MTALLPALFIAAAVLIVAGILSGHHLHWYDHRPRRDHR